MAALKAPLGGAFLLCSGGRDVGLGDGVASLICGDWNPMALFCCRRCAGLGTSVTTPVELLLIAESRVPAAVAARRPGLLNVGLSAEG